MKMVKDLILSLIFCLSIGVITATGQTTEFTYQGNLVDAGLPANANYDFEFRLFPTSSGGAAIATQTRLAVPVANGIFAVTLDFGGQFDGNARWLEVAVKPAGSSNPPTVLTPRQAITSTPHSIRSLSSARADVATNSLQLGGVNAGQYVLTTDSRMVDLRNPLPNSANYVQNSTALQTSTNFNISGNGTAGGTLSATAINAATQFNSNGNRILSNAGTGNLFAGVGAGPANTTGSANSFFGFLAGSQNTNGSSNSFFGNQAAGVNTSGSENSFFGVRAGAANTSGGGNSFFGFMAGNKNTTGVSNDFFGYGAGRNNNTGRFNSFFGGAAGGSNTTGQQNAFFGIEAGIGNTTGTDNTIIGSLADVGSGSLDHATAIGSGAVVNTSNTIALGRSNGSDKVVVYGLGTVGITDVCRNASKELSTCSSSLRYKTHIQPFSGGLNLLSHLRPITFNWKDGGTLDVGFGAEDVEKVERLLVTYNAKGEIEGVKYGQLTTVLVNAIREQQTQIEQQHNQIEAQRQQSQRQQQQLNALKKLACRSHRRAGLCR